MSYSSLREALNAICESWRKIGNELKDEPEYDGGYGKALLTCADQIEIAMIENPE